MEQCMHERGAPCLADHLRADDDVAELARQPLRERLARVDREGERIRRLVDPEVLGLQRAALLRADECDAELAGVDTLARQDAPRQLAHGRLVDADARAIVELDLDHRVRGSECCLYASTMRCTSLCRTTSWWLKCTN